VAAHRAQYRLAHGELEHDDGRHDDGEEQRGGAAVGQPLPAGQAGEEAGDRTPEAAGPGVVTGRPLVGELPVRVRAGRVTGAAPAVRGAAASGARVGRPAIRGAAIRAAAAG
jgi:hypothetical protein